MKTYEEMASRVLARRDAYRKMQKKRRLTLLTSALLIAVLAVGGVGLYQSGHKTLPPITPAVSTADESTVDTVAEETMIKENEGENEELTAAIDVVAADVTAVEKPGEKVEGTPEIMESHGDPIAASGWVVDGTPRLEDTPAPIAPSVNDVCHLPMQGALDAEDGVTVTVLPMIESFPVEGVIAFDKAVDNGGVLYSPSLLGAMDAYREGARYRVIVEMFRDGQEVGDKDTFTVEAERLRPYGIITAIETAYDHEEVVWERLTLHAEYEQLRAFAPSEEYGYYLKLNGELKPASDENDVVFEFNGGMEAQ